MKGDGNEERQLQYAGLGMEKKYHRMNEKSTAGMTNPRNIGPNQFHIPFPGSEN